MGPPTHPDKFPVDWGVVSLNFHQKTIRGMGKNSALNLLCWLFVGFLDDPEARTEKGSFSLWVRGLGKRHKSFATSAKLEGMEGMVSSLKSFSESTPMGL